MLLHGAYFLHVGQLHRLKIFVGKHAHFFTTSLQKYSPRSEEFDSKTNSTINRNQCGIQMLPQSLYKQIFGNKNSVDIPRETYEKTKEHLISHGLWGKPTSTLPEFDLKLPDLNGETIAEHFENIAQLQCGSYVPKLKTLTANTIPPIPSEWCFTPGWTKYDEMGRAVQVNFPDEESYIFDVEVCVKEGHCPTLATAVSNSFWYSWCSDQLFDKKVQGSIHNKMGQSNELKYLINLETSVENERLLLKDQKERIVIGHNVSYDRARVKEQYFLEGTKLRFLDTMALHIAISGITSFQRSMLLATRNGRKLVHASPRGKYGKTEEIIEWQNLSSLNGLSDVHKLYCGGLGLTKDKRNIFVSGSLDDIKNDFQQLVTYCANDCKATFEVFCVLFAEYQKRFPHPVTFAGMMEMSTAYLPVNSNWERYLKESEDTYRDFENDLTLSIRREADRVCWMKNDQTYETDPWLWDLDWSTKQLKIKKTASKIKKNKVKQPQWNNESQAYPGAETESSDADIDFERLSNQFSSLLNSKTNLYKRTPVLPGYPNWYRALCDPTKDGLVGPSEITTSTQVVPKLLKLTWDSFPLYHSRELGWGYLVPGRPLEMAQAQREGLGPFPLKQFLSLCPPRASSSSEMNESKRNRGTITAEEVFHYLNQLPELTADPLEIANHWKATYESWEAQSPPSDNPRKMTVKTVNPSQTSDHPGWHSGIGPYDVGLPGCWFFKLPHKSGVDNNVGNPLAKDYLTKIEDGTLRTASSSIAEHVLKLNQNIIYWRNARDRVLSQFVLWLKKSELPRNVTKSEEYDPTIRYGAILPQIVTSGTLTRRAVESTWMTASNAYKDRIGSELKAMVQCPPGYNFVGADVDSQELWIASIIGDSHFAGLHGSTAFGWMTLQGKKTDGTDMHSRTASTVQITRDQAKILNYGRIYGAGERFAKSLLMQFNHRLTEQEASEKARKMYSVTKGNPVFKLNYRGRQLATSLGINCEELVSQEQINFMRKSARESRKLAQFAKLSKDELVEGRLWDGGTESSMFNKLEEIAQSESPRTPVLNCRISRALEPRNVGKEFMTSRVNWVVQSSAVDYLHLMIVAMRFLCLQFKIDCRFCISIHDEVRYIVKAEDKFRAALALQIANLWTRCMFSYQLNLKDLPWAVAFFSSVEVDTVLRKEPSMDCVTPSNPYGLKQGYGIENGKSYDIYEIIQKTNGTLFQNK